MVAIGIFTDDGEFFLMGKDRASAIDCATKAMMKRTYRLIEDPAQRVTYLARAMEVIEKEGE
jgi:hypothetical protein